MENVKSLLDTVKTAKGIESDYALAKTLDLPNGHISEYYSGKRSPNEFACLKIAQALNRPLADVLAVVRIAAEKDEKRRQAWKDYYKSIGGIAAGFALAVLVGVTTLLTPSPAQAAPMLENASGMICIM